ncbi:MAG: DAK2 domain-containing protein [Clostridiaceae bacterium]
MEFSKIDGKIFSNMIINAANSLEDQKEYVNSLNVFPVPDGDTGTNMSMTFKAAVDEIKNSSLISIDDVAKKVSRGALMGARGNSGVILSQIFRGFSKALNGKIEANADDIKLALKEGSNSAYKAVMRPTEGTILTIIRAAGEFAEKSEEQDVTNLFKEVCNHCEYVLSKTPDMLPVLKKAKVVDAGGMGLLILLKGMFDVLNNNITETSFKEQTKEIKNQAAKNLGEQDIKFGYCTEFFVIADNADINKFKYDLEKYGDSMVVVGLEDIIKVHIHTNEPGVVLSMALELGQLSKVKIDNMREQHKHVLLDENEMANTQENEEMEVEIEEDKKYCFISVAMGEGIKKIFEDLGVDYVIEGGQTMNPSTQDIIGKIEKINADNIIILPNNGNIIMAATQAAELSDKNVVVLPTKTIPQGITALTLFNQDEDLESNIEVMTEAISSVKTGQITYAVRDTEMDGKDIKEGNIIGLVSKSIVSVGDNIYNVCDEVIDSMIDEDSELITVFYGKDTKADEIEAYRAKLEDEYDDFDVHFYEGKQPLYYFIVSVE